VLVPRCRDQTKYSFPWGDLWRLGEDAKGEEDTGHRLRVTKDLYSELGEKLSELHKKKV